MLTYCHCDSVKYFMTLMFRHSSGLVHLSECTENSLAHLNGFLSCQRLGRFDDFYLLLSKFKYVLSKIDDIASRHAHKEVVVSDNEEEHFSTCPGMPSTGDIPDSWRCDCILLRYYHTVIRILLDKLTSHPDFETLTGVSRGEHS